MTQSGPPPTVRGRPSGREATLPNSLNTLNKSRFGFAEARHLLLRAGFGGTPAQVQRLVRMGPDAAVDSLLNPSDPGERVQADAFDSDIMAPLSPEDRERLQLARREQDEDTVDRFRRRRQAAQRADRQQIRAMQSWWLSRMIDSPRPLEEKMTLFWHGHFATGYRTIENSYHMYMQNQRFRNHALGNYAELLREMIRDPALLAYLDNHTSRRERPNENLARELMELFSLGAGNYTEADIRNGARALTGYTFRHNEFVFLEDRHDQGSKSILGRRGALDGDDFVDAILAHPACARFMALKLYRFFVREVPWEMDRIDGPTRVYIGRLATLLRGSNYRIAPVLRRMMLSEHFYHPAVMNQRIKSPVELVVGSVRSLGAPTRDVSVLVEACDAMGQTLFEPPSVKGWDGGRSWINTATLFARQNTAAFLLTGLLPGRNRPVGDVYDPAPLLDPMRQAGVPADADSTADYLLRFALGHADGGARKRLASFFEERGGRPTPDALTGALLAITAMPEYQLC